MSYEVFKKIQHTIYLKKIPSISSISELLEKLLKFVFANVIALMVHKPKRYQEIMIGTPHIESTVENFLVFVVRYLSIRIPKCYQCSFMFACLK